MKKIIAIVLTLVMILSMTAYAGGTTGLFPIIKSGAVTTEVTLECDAPGVVAGIGALSFIEPELFMNGLSNLKIKSDERYDINDDYTRIVAGITLDMELPLDFNANLQIGTRAKAGLWLEYDVTDEKNPIFKVIFSTPVDKRYIVVDVVEELTSCGYDMDRLASDFKKHINKEAIEEYAQKINDMMMSNATVTEGKNSLTVSLSGEQYMNLVKDLMEYFSGFFSAYEAFGVDFGANVNTEEVLPEGMNIEMVLQINYDSNGEMVDSDMKFTVSYDEEMAKEAGMNSFSVAGNSVYSGINLPISIEFPELTEENSVYYSELYDIYGYCGWITITYNDYIPAKDGKFYIPLTTVLKELRGCGHQYTIENHSGNVVITSTDTKGQLSKLEFAIDSCEFSVDSEKFVASNPFVYKNGAIYVDNQFLQIAFGYTHTEARSDILSKKTIVYLERECPENGFVEDEDDYYNEADDEFWYCQHFENLWIPVDYPGFNNDYFGLRAVIDNHEYANTVAGQFEMSYDNGVVTIVNNEEDDYFKTAVLTVGSNIVTVDGVEHQTVLPAVNKDGKVYVDKDAIKAILKYDIKRINIIYPADGGESLMSADFERQAPYCTHLAEEIKWSSDFYYDYY